jgi:putative ABC transport system permease protein
MPLVTPPIFLIVRLGLKSLLLHGLRSTLAVLGIVIGIASMIAMVTIGEGSKQEALEQIKRLGATNIIIKAVKPPDDSSTQTRRSPVMEYGLNRADLDRIVAIPTIWRALPMRVFNNEARYLANKLDARVVGTTPMYGEINKLSVARGRFLSESDLNLFENVAVLGSNAAAELFGFEDPLDRSVKLNNHYYRVVGIMASRVPTAGAGGSQAAENFNDDIYIPLTTCRSRFGETTADRRSGTFSAERVQLHQITVSVYDTSQVRPTGDIIRNLLEKYHKKEDWALTVPLDLLEEAERTRKLFNVLLGCIGGISLVVGGIGIMNIMLATVMERTREIGVRRALGAKRGDITMQFLVEALMLTGIGGAIGLLLGLFAPFGIRWVAEQFFHSDIVKIKINLVSLPIAAGFSIAVGVLFGLYPARRAAYMDPIEALRHE